MVVSPATLCITMTRMPGVQGAPNRNPALLVTSRSSPFFSPVRIFTSTTCSPTRVPVSVILSCMICVTTAFSKVCPSLEMSGTLSTRFSHTVNSSSPIPAAASKIRRTAALTDSRPPK